MSSYVYIEFFISFRPQLFLDVAGILNGVRCDSVITTLSNKSISLFQFLSASYDDLKSWGVDLPYQCERIIGGVHQFHKRPYLPNSLHIVPLKDNFR